MDDFTKAIWQHVDLPIFLVTINLAILSVFTFSTRKKAIHGYYLFAFTFLNLAVECINLLAIHYQINQFLMNFQNLINITAYLFLYICCWKYIAFYYNKKFLKLLYFSPTIILYLIFALNLDIKVIAFQCYKLISTLAVVITLFQINRMFKSPLSPLSYIFTKKAYLFFIFMFILYPVVDIIHLEKLSLLNFNQIASNLYIVYFLKYSLFFVITFIMLALHRYIMVNNASFHRSITISQKSYKLILVFFSFYFFSVIAGSIFVSATGNLALKAVLTAMTGTANVGAMTINETLLEELSADTISEDSILKAMKLFQKIEAADRTLWFPRIYLNKHNRIIVITPQSKYDESPAKVYIKDYSKVPKSVYNILSKGDAISLEWPYATPDGVFCTLFVPVETAYGTPLGALAVDLDTAYWHEVNLMRKTFPSFFIILIAALAAGFIRYNQKYQIDNIIGRVDHELLLEAQKASQIGSWTINFLTSKSEWSEGLFQILGAPYSSQQVSIDKLLDFIHPDDKEIVSKILHETNKGDTGRYHCRLLLKDKQLRHVIITIKPILEKSNKINIMIGTMQDITKLKLLEEEIVFKKALDKSQLMSFSFNRDGNIIYLNEAFTENTGWNIQELSASKWAEHIFVKSEKNNRNVEILNQLYSGNDDLISELNRFETQLYTKSNETLICELSGTVIQDSRGEIVNITFIGENITKKRQLEELVLQKMREAEKANQSKSRFVANMSHEIRTPLNAILGFSQILYDDKSLNEKQKEFINTINRSGEHLLSLINDILEMSKIESGNTTFNPSTIHLPVFISEIQNMFILRANLKNITLLVEHTNLPDYIYTDENKLKQIIINILGNAVKFTDSGGISWILKMERKLDSDFLIFEINDTGRGIKPDETDLIFLPFEQTESGKTSPGGTGLGLAISKELAVFLGGNISVKSKYELGTSFRVELPVKIQKKYTPSETANKKSVIGIAEGKHPRILIVDDKEENISVLRELLVPMGFQVFEAYDGKQALEIFAKQPLDLIIMDMRMPVLDGYEASQQIRSTKVHNDIPIIALTASAFEEDKEHAQRIGINAYVRKPFKRTILFNAIKECIPIDFVYDNEQTEGDSDQKFKINFTKIPADMLKNFETVLNSAYVDEISETIQEIQVYLDEKEYKQLNALSNQFQYEKIIEAIKPYIV